MGFAATPRRKRSSPVSYIMGPSGRHQGSHLALSTLHVAYGLTGNVQQNSCKLALASYPTYLLGLELLHHDLYALDMARQARLMEG